MSIFPTKILLATDRSRDAEPARTTAVDLANSTDSEVHVVTVAPGYPSYDIRNPAVVEQLRKHKTFSTSRSRRSSSPEGKSLKSI